MSLTRKHLMILVAMLGLLALAACTREINTVVQEQPQPSSCFECHSDANTRLVAIEGQWAESSHAIGETAARSSTANCAGCHCSEGFLQRLDGEEPTATTSPTVIHCFTCHAPHTNGDFGLRVTEAVEMPNGASIDIGKGNICVSCHQSRYAAPAAGASIVVDSQRWGPHHGTQGDLLLGTNGYEYAEYEYESAHYHRTWNDDGCVDCHMSTLKAGVGGHTFSMETTTLNVGVCNACHVDPLPTTGTLTYDYNGKQTEIEEMIETLRVQLADAGLLALYQGSWLPTPGTYSADDAGAIWNYLLVAEDRSSGAHNPYYAEGLLTSTIDYMEARPSI